VVDAVVSIYVDTKTKREIIMKVNDILVSCWGYEQTNVNFYKVVAVTAKSVKVVGVGQKIVKRETGLSDYVIPDLNAGNDYARMENKMKKVKLTKDGREFISISSFERAYVWSGSSVYQTNWH